MWLSAGLICTAAGLLLRSEYEKEQLSVEITAVESDKIERECRIAFLSDLHEHRFDEKNKKLLDAIDKVKPDLILVGGDMIVTKGTAETEVSLALMAELAARCPVFYGNGNHENRMSWERDVYGDGYEAYMKSLKHLGVKFLEDKTEYFRKDIAVTGVDLPQGCYRKFKPADFTYRDIEKKVGRASEKRFQILLCHSPLYFYACRSWGADLTLAGHFHGGTIRLPYFGGVMTPQYQFFLPWCAGAFEEDGRHMMVSRGLGTHSINIRINNKPQLVVVDLKKKG